MYTHKLRGRQLNALQYYITTQTHNYRHMSTNKYSANYDWIDYECF